MGSTVSNTTTDGNEHPLKGGKKKGAGGQGGGGASPPVLPSPAPSVDPVGGGAGGAEPPGLGCPGDAPARPSPPPVILRSPEGYSRYLASSEGTVYSRQGNGGFRELRHSPSPDGYIRLTVVGDDGKRWSTCQHNIVALAFHGKAPPGHVVRHRSHDPRDNRPENLVYGTQLENVRDSQASGRLPAGLSHGMARLSRDQVVVCREMAAVGVPYEVIAGHLNVSDSTVSRVVKRQTYRDVD